MAEQRTTDPLAGLEGPLIVAVSGGRDYTDENRIGAVLDELHTRFVIKLLIEGACPVGDGGADERARRWARRNEVNSLSIPPKAKRYGWPAAGPKRNEEMAHAAHRIADLWVLFPGGRGTASARAVAERYAIRTLEITP